MTRIHHIIAGLRIFAACEGRWSALRAVILIVVVTCGGCGKTLRNSATEQLVLADAVDRAVGAIDFTPLDSRTCYLASANLKVVKSLTIVNAEYVESALRNQMLAAGCLLVETEKEAEIIIEPRIGALATDEHEVTYGIPSSNLLSQAATLVPTAPPVPTIPEISLAKKANQTGAVRIALFAYEKKTGDPIWQSGNSLARSTARDTWMLGIGPFQSGTIYEKPRFAGRRLGLSLLGEKKLDDRRQTVTLNEQFVFQPKPVPVPEPVPPAEPAVEEKLAEKPAADASPAK